MTEPRDLRQPLIGAPSRTLPTGESRGYVRFAALGDSATHGVGDRADGAWRGWARLLADTVAVHHDVSFCNLAVPGATVADVVAFQLEDAVAHGPHLASLVVGINDALRSTWDAGRVRDELLACADGLTGAGAQLLTVRFHDHSRVFHLPKPLGRPLRRRIDLLNEAYDEVVATYGGIQVDLAACPEIYGRDFWSVDRLHPSELGHRRLACEFARLVNEAGLSFAAPSPTPTVLPPRRAENLRWMLTEGAPWMGRRARDLGPWAARTMLSQARVRFAA